MWADWIEDTWADARPDTVLDLCCGTGLMTEELIARGYSVSGLDASEAMLSLARVRLGPRPALVHAWLPDLPLTGPVDAVVSTMDGLNYLARDDLRATFAAVARVLRPGGWFVFDMHGPGLLDFIRDRPQIQGDNFTLTSMLDDRTVSTTVTFAGAEPFAETHVQHVHPLNEVTSALKIAGFGAPLMVDEYSDADVDPATLRTTLVTRSTQSDPSQLSR